MTCSKTKNMQNLEKFLKNEKMNKSAKFQKKSKKELT
jgi:hypothetical protein